MYALQLAYDRDIRRGHFALVMFFITAFAQKGELLLYAYTGVFLKSLFGGTLLILPPIFIGLSMYFYYSSLSTKQFLTTSLTNRVIVFLLYILFISIYGALNGNLVNLIFIDFWVYFIIIPAMVLGSNPLVWRKLYKPLVILYYIFFFIVYLGKDFLRLHYLEGGYSMDSFDSRLAVKTLAYELSPVLEFWPIIFTLSFFVKKDKLFKILGFLSLFFFLGLQVYFLKRAPSARAVAQLLLVVALYYKIKPSSFQIKRIVTVAILVISGYFIFSSLLPIDNLTKRFDEEDNSRQNEAQIMLSQLNPHEMIIGRGLGGYFYISDNDGTGIIPVNDLKHLGKAALHIGFFFIILKGGILYIALIVWLIFPMFTKWQNKLWLSNPYNFAATVSLLTYLAFRFIEGGYTTGAIFQAFLFGFCIGRVASSRFENVKDISFI